MHGMKIAIIGGGASGTLCSIHIMRLLENKPAAVSLEIFEQNPNQFNKGIAYSTTSPNHVLNVPASNMSIFADRPADFTDWLSEQGIAAGPAFVERRIYGRYLAERLTQYTSKSPHIPLNRVMDAIADIQAENGHWVLTSKNGKRFAADQVVLATGVLRPRDPKELTSAAAAHPGYFPDSWGVDWDKIGDEKSILFIGTGLSMIDGGLQLKARGHKGRIMALSRRGFMPRLHGAGKPFAGSLDFFLRISSVRERLKAFRKAAKDHEAAGGKWQDIFSAVRHHTTEAWVSLSLKERQRFLRHVKSFWEVHRHRVPAIQLGLIQELIDSGVLQVQQARIQSLDHDGQSFVLKCSGSNETLRFDTVINSTGPANDFRVNSLPPYQSLLASKKVLSDELGLGLQVTENLNLIGEAGPQAGLFAVGPLSKGRFWECTAVPDIREQAELVARQICGVNPEVKGAH